jgi:hypothetical protein
MHSKIHIITTSGGDMNRFAEKLVGTLLLISLVLVVLFQTLITRNVLIPASATDMRQDIMVYEKSEYYPNAYAITLSISDNKAKIMVNGYYVSDTIVENNYISFSVYDGDVVECDLRDCKDKVIIQLIKKDNNLNFPKNNFRADGTGTILYLFKVDGD